MKIWNITILLSTIWRILSNHNSIRVNWIKIHLLKGNSFWNVRPLDKCSYSWRMLLRIRNQVKDHFVVNIGNGESTSMWFDNWHKLGPLHYVLKPYEIVEAGYSLKDKVKDLLSDVR